MRAQTPVMTGRAARCVRRAALALLLAAAIAAMSGCGRPSPPAQDCKVLGIDVSRHQGEIDWRRVAASGVRFAWIKATEGGDYADPQFRRNWALAAASGVRRGAYLFVYWCRPAADQAAWFVANVPADPAALPPVLDVEWTPQSRSCPGKVSREAGIAAMKTILAALERAYGRRPVIYAPADFYSDVIGDQFADYPMWLRAVEGAPEDAYGPRDWLIWQYSETGAVDGVRGPVDLDCFRGTEAAWHKWRRPRMTTR